MQGRSVRERSAATPGPIPRTTMSPMAMGKQRRHAKQTSIWVATNDLPRSAAHPFYTQLNLILNQHDFDAYVEGLCERFYADEGRPGLPPGRYFRLLLIGYFEGLDAERAIAWRAADSFALREFSRLGVAGGATRSFDDLPHASLDRSGDARSGLHLDAAATCRCRPREGEDRRHRRDDAGGERGVA